MLDDLQSSQSQTNLDMSTSIEGTAHPTSIKPWLVCNGIEASYPEFRLHLDCTIKQGEMVSIIGPSGCGKSTTLQLISGLMEPDSGSIFLGDEDITAKPVWERNIGLVFQDYALFPHLNVEQNIAYSLKLQKVQRGERKSSVASLLALVGLEGYQKRKPSELSGGERQRVALARALASNPHLLLLDEPLSALDAQLRKHLRKEIRRIHDETGITTVYVTHDQEEALSLSDRIMVMHHGSVEQLATPEEVYHHPATLFAASFMGDGTVLPYDLIPKTLVSAEAGTTAFVFKQYNGQHQIFFRPEKVLVHDDPSLAFPEFLPHLRFPDATVTGCEYQGSRYLLECDWEGFKILACADTAPKHRQITLGVRLSNLVEYVDGAVVTTK